MSDVQSRAHLVAEQSRMYRPLVTTQDPSSSRSPAKRNARIILITGLGPVIPVTAFIIWELGFRSHPHHVAFACTFGAIFAAVEIFGLGLVYRIYMKRAREESAETGRAQG
jgi:hypothetical protein